MIGAFDEMSKIMKNGLTVVVSKWIICVSRVSGGVAKCVAADNPAGSGAWVVTAVRVASEGVFESWNAALEFLKIE